MELKEAPRAPRSFLVTGNDGGGVEKRELCHFTPSLLTTRCVPGDQELRLTIQLSVIERLLNVCSEIEMFTSVGSDTDRVVASIPNFADQALSPALYGSLAPRSRKKQDTGTTILEYPSLGILNKRDKKK